MKKNPPTPGYPHIGGGYFADAYKGRDIAEIILHDVSGCYDVSKEVAIAVRSRLPENLRKFWPEIIRSRIDGTEYVYYMPYYNRLSNWNKLEKPTEAEIKVIEDTIKQTANEVLDFYGRDKTVYDRVGLRQFSFDCNPQTKLDLNSIHAANLSEHRGVLILRDVFYVIMDADKTRRYLAPKFNITARFLYSAIR